MDMKAFVDRVKERMLILQIEPTDLRRLCGTQQSEISKLLNYKKKKLPSWSYRLSKALETNIKWLVTGVDEPASVQPKPAGMSIFETIAKGLKELDDDEIAMVDALLQSEVSARALKKSPTDGLSGRNKDTSCR